MSRKGSKEEIKNGQISPDNNTQNRKSQPSEQAEWDDGSTTAVDDDGKSHCQTASSSSLSSNEPSSSDSNKKESGDSGLDQNISQSGSASVPKNILSAECDANSQNVNGGRQFAASRGKPTEANFDRLQKAAETLMEKWTAEVNIFFHQSISI